LLGGRAEPRAGGLAFRPEHPSSVLLGVQPAYGHSRSTAAVGDVRSAPSTDHRGRGEGAEMARTFSAHFRRRVVMGRRRRFGMWWVTCGSVALDDLWRPFCGSGARMGFLVHTAEVTGSSPVSPTPRNPCSAGVFCYLGTRREGGRWRENGARSRVNSAVQSLTGRFRRWRSGPLATSTAPGVVLAGAVVAGVARRSRRPANGAPPDPTTTTSTTTPSTTTAPPVGGNATPSAPASVTRGWVVVMVTVSFPPKRSASTGQANRATPLSLQSDATDRPEAPVVGYVRD
jgi:hypothetical protein